MISSWFGPQPLSRRLSAHQATDSRMVTKNHRIVEATASTLSHQMKRRGWDGAFVSQKTPRSTPDTLTHARSQSRQTHTHAVSPVHMSPCEELPTHTLPLSFCKCQTRETTPPRGRLKCITIDRRTWRVYKYDHGVVLSLSARCLYIDWRLASCACVHNDHRGVYSYICRR